MTTLGVIFPPDQPPEGLRAVVRAAEDSGLEQLWLWEDCFREGGIATAAAALAWTERLGIGLGLMPVPLRNVALTAMEIATVARMFPGRFFPGVGHGVLDWMGQVGARAESPMTLLREYTSALRSLLHGESVTVAGRYIHLSEVKLDWPPLPPPDVLVGGIGPRTVALAGECGDGVIFTEQTLLDGLASGIAQFHAGRRVSGRGEGGPVVLFHPVDGRDAAAVAGRASELAEGGATHVIFLQVGDAPVQLTEFVHFIATEVRPLLD